jgi:serine phosphatase RsbU (regulator of sigma subunit)
LFATSSNVSKAQRNTRAESLHQRLRVAKEDTLKVQLYNDLCMSYLLSSPDTALTYATEGLKLAEKIGDKKGKALSLNRIGSVHTLQGNYASGMENLLLSLRISEELNDKMLVARALNNLSHIYTQLGEHQQALESFQKLLEVSLEEDNKQGMAVAYGNLGEALYRLKRYDESIEKALAAGKIAEEINFLPILGSTWANLANNCLQKGDLKLALDYAHKSIALNRELQQKNYESSALSSLSNIYLEMDSLKKAEMAGLEAMEIAQTIKAKDQIREAAEVLGKIYRKIGDFKKAFDYQQLFIDTREDMLGEQSKQRMEVLRATYELDKKESEIALLSKNQEVSGMFTLMLAGSLVLSVVLAMVYFRGSKHKQRANDILLNRNKEISHQNEEIKVQSENLKKANEKIVQQNDEIKKAYQNLELLSKIGQKITSILSVSAINEMVYENVNKLMDATGFGIGVYSEENKGIEFIGFMEKGEKIPYHVEYLDDKSKVSVWCFLNNQEVKMSNVIEDFYHILPDAVLKVNLGDIVSSLIYLPLRDLQGKPIGVITVQSFQENAYTDYHLNILKNLGVYASIAIQNAKIFTKMEEQRTQISDINAQITQSISYAQQIQKALLSYEKLMSLSLSDHFILWMPRDLVSGDFCWFRKYKDAQGNEKMLLAAVDCTGHGIPGAFMSLIGDALLNKVVVDEKEISPDRILKELHKNIRKSLKQQSSDNRDGMDMGLVVIDKQNKKMEFAGAKTPLVYFQPDESGVWHLNSINGDRFGVGGEQTESERTFTKHLLDISKPTTFYLFSDGYQDQFGGPKGKKFMSKRFRELLSELHLKPVLEQRNALRMTIQGWMEHSKEAQVDDILVIGVKLT